MASPYFNGRKQLLLLLDYLVKCKQEGKVPVAENAFQAAFPDETFEVKKWRLSLSQLYKLAEQFISLQTRNEDDFLPKLQLAEAYQKRELDGHLQRTVLSTEKLLAGQKQESARHFENQYLLEEVRYRMLSSGKRTETLNLQETSDAMDTAFIARKLRHACFSISHQAVYKTEYEFGLLEAVLDTVSKTPALLAKPAVGLYYHCYIALTKNNERQFQTFNQLLSEQAGRLPKEERQNLYLLAINFGIRQINALRPEYYRPVLDLYKKAIENGLLLQNGQLSHFAYNNIVAIGLRIGENEWVGNFIHSFKNHLDRKHRNVTFSLNLARLEYAKKNYGEALLNLQKSDYKDFINNVIAKTLQLKIYYETDELEVLEPHLRSMKTYIRRKRAFGYHRENYLNIIRFTQAIIELNPFDNKKKNELRKQISGTERLTEREWLLEMLERV